MTDQSHPGTPSGGRENSAGYEESAGYEGVPGYDEAAGYEGYEGAPGYEGYEGYEGAPGYDVRGYDGHPGRAGHGEAGGQGNFGAWQPVPGGGDYDPDQTMHVSFAAQLPPEPRPGEDPLSAHGPAGPPGEPGEGDAATTWSIPVIREDADGDSGEYAVGALPGSWDQAPSPAPPTQSFGAGMFGQGAAAASAARAQQARTAQQQDRPGQAGRPGPGQGAQAGPAPANYTGEWPAFTGPAGGDAVPWLPSSPPAADAAWSAVVDDPEAARTGPGSASHPGDASFAVDHPDRADTSSPAASYDDDPQADLYTDPYAGPPAADADPYGQAPGGYGSPPPAPGDSAAQAYVEHPSDPPGGEELGAARGGAADGTSHPDAYGEHGEPAPHAGGHGPGSGSGGSGSSGGADGLSADTYGSGSSGSRVSGAPGSDRPEGVDGSAAAGAYGRAPGAAAGDGADAYGTRGTPGDEHLPGAADTEAYGDAAEVTDAAGGPESAEPEASGDGDRQHDGADPSAGGHEGAAATDPGTDAGADPATAVTPEAEETPAEETHSEHPLASYMLRVNGAERPVTDAWLGESLLYVLRERLGLAGAKDGCEQGECGACSVQVDGRLVASCLVPAATAAGSEVRTVEGLTVEGRPSTVQRALAESGAVQCGFCIPGMAMTVHDLLEGNHRPTDLDIRQALSGNLCRCSGYRGVLEAVRQVVADRDARDAEDGGAADDPSLRVPHQGGPAIPEADQ